MLVLKLSVVFSSCFHRRVVVFYSDFLHILAPQIFLERIRNSLPCPNLSFMEYNFAKSNNSSHNFSFPPVKANFFYDLILPGPFASQIYCFLFIFLKSWICCDTLISSLLNSRQLCAYDYRFPFHLLSPVHPMFTLLFCFSIQVQGTS